MEACVEGRLELIEGLQKLLLQMEDEGICTEALRQNLRKVGPSALSLSRA
jgi:hypothetical protein